MSEKKEKSKSKKKKPTVCVTGASGFVGKHQTQRNETTQDSETQRFV